MENFGNVKIDTGAHVIYYEIKGNDYDINSGLRLSESRRSYCFWLGVEGLTEHED